VHPDTMEQILNTKSFTNGSDRVMVAGLYREFFQHVCRSVTQLHFQKNGTGAGWGPEEAAQLADALREFHCCANLQLSGHPIGDEGVHSIALALVDMPCLKTVEFDGCSFGALGLRALTRQLEQLTMLDRISLPEELEHTQEANEIDSLAEELSSHGVRCMCHKPLKVAWGA